MTVLWERTQPITEERSTRRAAVRLLGGWLPAILTVVGMALWVHSYGVSVRDILAFGGYLLLGITLPGALWWRAARRSSHTLAEDLAVGTALGYALEVLTYLPARAAGVPLAVLAWPAATYLLFALVPGLRACWRMRASARPPVWFAWLVAVLTCYPAIWTGEYFFRTHGLTYPGSAAPYIDLPYYLSLIGELKHHVPAMFPFEVGQPLTHHWLLHPEIAATSWVTGIEPQTLLYRLSALPMMLVFGVIVALLGRHVVGAWWAGAATLAGTWLFLGPAPIAWAGRISPAGGFQGMLWLCPTQTFSAVLFAGAMLMLAYVLKESRRRAGMWAVLAVLVAVAMGAKGTFGALLIAGLGAALLFGLVFHRRPDRTVLIALGGALVLLAASCQLIFDGESFGLRMLVPSPRMAAQLSRIGITHPPKWMYLILVAVMIGGWLCAGALALRLSRAQLREPITGVIAGIGVASMGTALLLAHPAFSEIYFIVSAWPYICLLVVMGLAAVLRSPAPGGRWLYAAAAAGGALLSYLSVKLGQQHRPATAGEHGMLRAAISLVAPWAVLVIAGLVLAVALAWRAGAGQRRRLSVTLLALVLTGFALQTSLVSVRPILHPAQAAPQIPAGALEAGRWLRANSSPDDLVATNSHCYEGSTVACDSRQFWVSAYSERRVLVESWGYTAWAHAAWIPFRLRPARVPFHHPELLADNDRAFAQPSASSIARLRDAYHVKWLFVDLTQNAPADGLDQVATLRFADGSVAVYEI